MVSSSFLFKLFGVILTLLLSLSGTANAQDRPLRAVNERNLRVVIQGYPANAVIYEPIGDWDVSRVTDFSGLFVQRPGFNDDISAWDTSSATNMAFMFEACESFDQDLSAWDVSNVRDFAGMFTRATKFNADISGWDVSRADNMAAMLSGCPEFDQDLSDWDVSNVETLSNMFALSTKFNSDLADWDVSKVKDMEAVFYQAFAFNSDIGNWTTLSVTNMNSMFFAAQAFNWNLNRWDTSKVTNMNEVFKRAARFSRTVCWDLSSIVDQDNGRSGVFEAFASTAGTATFNSWCINVPEDEENAIRDDSLSNLNAWNNACPRGAISLGGGLCICFSGSMEVELENGSTKRMDQLQLGDRVLTSEGDYSMVYSFGHKNSEDEAEYLQIHSKSIPKPLEISSHHLIFVDADTSVPASQLAQGDALWTADGNQALIDEIKHVKAKGSYAPFTTSGTIVVNNVVASSYVAMDDSTQMFTLGGIPLFSHHWGAHVSTAPMRLYCRYIAECNNETYTADGLSTMTAGPYAAGSWLMQLKNPYLQIALFAPAFIMALALAGVEYVLLEQRNLCVLLTALVAGYLYVNNNKQKKSKA